MSSVAERLRQKLLDLAIRGKLVPQNPNDEPADKLLTRIRKSRVEVERGRKGRAVSTKSPLSISDDEKPFDLPKGWVWCRLGEMAEIVTGATPSTSHPEYFNGDIPFIKPADIGDSDFINNCHETLTAKGAETVRIVPAGSVCVCCIGSIGKAGIAKNACCTNQQINSVIAQGVDEKWLYYAILSKCFQMRLKAAATAITIALVNKSAMSAVPIPLPPLAEQKRIVKTLDALLKDVDTIAAGMAKLADIKERARAKILDLAIRGKLVKQDSNDEPADKLLERIKNSRVEAEKCRKGRAVSMKPPLPITDDEKPFDLPKGWVWCRLGEIADYVGGTTPAKSDLSTAGIPYFKVAEMNLPGNEVILHLTNLFVRVDAVKKVFQKGTIVFPKNGGALLTNKKRVLGQDSICDLNTGGLVSIHDCISPYLKMWFLSIDLKKYLSGGVIPTINGTCFCQTPIPLPPLAEQHRIVAKVDEMLAACEQLTGGASVA